ncbi:hypothetical protein ABPG72_007805 [Tetrahymena utriculariae]
MKEKYGIDASYSMIYSQIKQSGLKYGKVQQVHELNLQNKHDRLIDCKKEAYQNQDYTLNTDESIFSLHDNTIDVWHSEVYNNKLESKNCSMISRFQHKKSSIQFIIMVEGILFVPQGMMSQLQIFILKNEKWKWMMDGIFQIYHLLVFLIKENNYFKEYKMDDRWQFIN